MKYLKQLLITNVLIIIMNNCAFAVTQSGITVGMTGVESNGIQVFIGISPNPNGCINNGVYFKDPGALDKALSVALSAKMAGKTVRIDYLQSGGSGTQCMGYSIYAQ